MVLSKILTILTIASLTAAGHLPSGSSYSVLTKHEEPHHYHGGHAIGIVGAVGPYGLGGHGSGLVLGSGLGSAGYGGLGGGYASGYDHDDYHHHPKYTFKYGVKDPHTGDNKDQWEHRDGDKVHGAYSLQEADGTKRVVEYTADDHNGFQAVVKQIGHAYHPQHYQSQGHYGAGVGPILGGGGGHYHHASSYVHVDQLNH